MRLWLCVPICVFVAMYPCASVFVCVFVCVSAYGSVCLRVSVYVSVSACVCVSISLCMHSCTYRLSENKSLSSAHQFLSALSASTSDHIV